MDLALPSKGDRGGQGVGGALQKGVSGPGLHRRCKPQIRYFPLICPCIIYINIHVISRGTLDTGASYCTKYTLCNDHRGQHLQFLRYLIFHIRNFVNFQRRKKRPTLNF